MDSLENILIGIDMERSYERLTKREKKSVNESRQKGINKLKYF
jgi:hypothetical protein